jgi:hypothetical protein
MTPPLLTDGAFGSMDYDATTGQVYVPDRRHQHIAVLRPVELASSPPPAEPLRTIAVQGVPDAIAITGDGQLGFIALRGGNVAMLDVPVHQIVDTIYVGGTPHFIITGLYPPPPGTTLAQQPTAPPFPFWKTVLLGLLSAIFFLSLAGLFLVLRLFWKQRLR